MLNKDIIKDVFHLLSINIENPKTELIFFNNYTLLVAVILSAQAKDSMVNIATKPLFKLIKTPEKMIDLGEENLIPYIKMIGLYKNKAKNIIEMSSQLIKSHSSVVPNNFDDLIQLSGVGRKTANVILNIAFKKNTMPVDTHVYRLAHRLGLSQKATVLGVEQDLLEKIPDPFKNTAHHLLILHGRYTCKAKGFNCSKCFLNRLCEKNI